MSLDKHANTTEQGCPECAASFVERTHGGDLAVYECGSESSMCADGCCGDLERTPACRLIEQRTSERDDAARILHARAIAGSEASKGLTEFVYMDGRFAGTAYSSGERWIAFGPDGRFVAAGLTLGDATDRLCAEITGPSS